MGVIDSFYHVTFTLQNTGTLCLQHHPLQNIGVDEWVQEQQIFCIGTIEKIGDDPDKREEPQKIIQNDMPTHPEVNPRRNLQLVSYPEEITGHARADGTSKSRQDIQDGIYPKPDTKKINLVSMRVTRRWANSICDFMMLPHSIHAVLSIYREYR